MADNLLSSFLPDDRASFGIFPQMKPRRRFQDPVGAANVPLDVTRGRVAGLAGLLPDTLNFMGRSPMPTEMFGETQYEPTPQLPYGSEYFLQNLPLKPTSRIGEVAGQVGAFVPLNPMPAARAVAAGVKALGPTAVRMGESYLQSKGLMPGVVPEAPVTPATPLASMMEKPQAPVSELGFYSAAEQAALNLPRKSGTGESFLNDLMKGQDVKKDELSWMGLDDYLKGKPNVTRQEVQDFIANNRVDVREVRLGEPSNINKFSDVQLDAEHQRMFGTSLENDYGPDWRTRRQDIIDELANPELESNISGATKYQQYQLPGGENYREILLTLPNKPMEPSAAAKLYYENYKQRGGEPNWSELPVEARQSIIDSMPAAVRNASGVPEYSSSHFNEPNILAHMRVNDRVDADGKKMLLIEEIQSDWHQAGREKGYQSANSVKAKQAFTDYSNELANKYNLNPEQNLSMYATMKGMKPEEVAKYDQLQSAWISTKEGVPDAPFKGTWHQLALKRALKYAADNGYDRVGLTTGRQQVDRYANEMRQNVDEIQFQTGQKLTDSQANELQLLRNKARDEGLSKLNGTERQRYDNLLNNEGEYVGKNQTKIKAFKGSDSTFSGIVKDGKFLDGPAAGKTVTEVLGKSMAKKIAEQRTGTIKGDDLTIGGEGMKAYYDEIYPAFLAKQGKKYNAKTGETRIKTGNAYAQTKGIPAEQSIRYIDISPEMRGGVKKGQPLFTAAPIGGIGLGAGTQDQQQNSINSFIQ